MSRSRARLAADWFAKLRQNAVTQEVEHTDVVAAETEALEAKADAAAVGETPAGTVIFYAENSAPSGYLKANGASLSTTTYATLFAAIGYTFGGSGAAFNVPDLRGEFLRGWDDSRGVDSGRSFSSFQDYNASYLRTVAVQDPQSPYESVTVPQSGYSPWLKNYYQTGGGDGLIFENSGGEARPRNRALLACIKY